MSIGTSAKRLLVGYLDLAESRCPHLFLLRWVSLHQGVEVRVAHQTIPDK